MPDGLPVITPGSPVRDLWPPERGGYAGRMGTIAQGCLQRARVGTVGELTAMSALDITEIRQAGAAVVGEIRRVLRPHGLDLKDGEGVAPAEAAARARILARAGLRRPHALRFARDLWPSGEIAPGVVLTVTEANHA
jgi:hypothetical protein